MFEFEIPHALGYVGDAGVHEPVGRRSHAVGASKLVEAQLFLADP